MDPREAFANLNPIALFAGCILPMVAAPIGVGVALVVRRIMPLANILLATILAGYIVAVVILFVLLRRLFPETLINVYSAATVSLITAAGVMVFLAYSIHHKLFTKDLARKESEKKAETFAVFGEDVRARPRRKK
jgi:hypothetical protein